MTSGAYMISCIASGKVYVGSSGDIRKRMEVHIRTLRAGRHVNSELQADFDLHGENKFSFSVLDVVKNKRDRLQRERELIEHHKSHGNTYNVTTILDASIEVAPGLTIRELTEIVDAWGGPEKFARIIDAKKRTVESWLYGERNIKPPIAKLIRSLKPPKPRKSADLGKRAWEARQEEQQP